MFKPLAASAIVFVVAQCSFGQSSLWSDAEKNQIRQFWMEPGRYSVTPSDKYVVRLTTVGSKWFWDYNHLRGHGKTPPTQIPGRPTMRKRRGKNG